MSFKFLGFVAISAFGLHLPIFAQSSAWSGYISYFDAGGTLRKEANLPICNYVKNGTMRIDPPQNATIRAQYYTNFEFTTPICVDDNFTYEVRVRNGALTNGISAYDMILDLRTPSGQTAYTLMGEAWAQQWTNVIVGGETVLSNSPNLIVDYSNWTTLKISFQNKNVSFFANNRLLVSRPYNGNVCNLNGFFMRFKGAAAVDWIRIMNDDDKTVVYNEEFTNCADLAKPIDCIANINATVNTPCEGDALKFTSTTRANNYEWTGPNNFRSTSKEPNISKTDNSMAGVYTLKAQFNACQFLTKTLNVTINSKPIVNFGRDTAICNGVAYTLDAKNTGSTYKWHNGTTNRLFSVKNSGTFSVTVTTPAGCVASDTVKIDVPPTPVAPNFTIKKPSCYGKCNGEVAASPSGGFGTPYTFRWSGGRTTSDVVGRCAGDISLTITDSKGCKLETVASVPQPPKIEVKAVADTIYNGYAVRCADSQDGQATVKPQGGAGNFTIVWKTTPAQTERTAIGLKADTLYKVLVYDKNGCSDSTTVKLTAPPPILAEFSTKSPRCFGDKDGEIVVEKIKGGTAPYSFSFEEKKYPFDGTPMRLKNLVSGAYFLIASDANGCTQPQNLNIIAPPKLSIISTDDTLIHFGDDIQLFANVATPSVLGAVKWSSSRDSVGLNCTNCPSIMVSPRLTTFFNVIVKDSFGCEAKKQILIKVDKLRRVFVPTAFSPNEDGHNDYIMVHSGRGARKIHNFSIFNRWGSMVHQVKNITPNDDMMSWDGRFRGKELPTDIYIWFIEVEFEDGEKEIFKGDFSLIR
jgi:gliding motility-associated-like protein